MSKKSLRKGQNIQERMKRKYQEEAYRDLANYIEDIFPDVDESRPILTRPNLHEVIREFMLDKGITPKEVK